MFAAASGARLAHRHNKPAVKKQVSSSQIEGLQVHYKAFQLQQQKNRLDGPNLGPTAQARLELSYLDLNSRISKLDFEGDGLSSRREVHEPPHSATSQGKAAWQDRELSHDIDNNDSFDVNSDGASTHRSKQKEAHRRWVKRNRIHDSSVGDCSSDEDDLYGPYGVHSAAANSLLYIGLGTMAIGMIISFVGTGEKGFKTMELRLIGPSLICAGVLIVVLRIALCVCPFHCLKHKRKHKHKHKNSTNKLNSEDAATLLNTEKSKTIATESVTENRDGTATVSFLECERSIEMKPLNVPIVSVDAPRTPSDISVTSLTNGLVNPEPEPTIINDKKISKFETTRIPRNGKPGELLLSPMTLEDVQENF